AVRGMMKDSIVLGVKGRASIGAFGGFMQAGEYWMDPKAHPEGFWNTVIDGAVSSAAWNGVVFMAFAFPSAAIEGQTVFHRLYKGFGNSYGPVGGAVRLAMKMKDRLWSSSVANGIVKHEQGFWGYVGERMEAAPGGATLSARAALKTAT